MKPVAESSKAADTERFEREVGVWKPTTRVTLNDLWNIPAPPPPNPAERVIFALRDGGMSKEQAERMVAATVGGAK